MSRRLLSGATLSAILLLIAFAPALGDPEKDWSDHPDVQALHKWEAKQLRGLLKKAGSKKHWYQIAWLADQILRLDPEDKTARKARKKLADKGYASNREPEAPWIEQRTRTFDGIAEKYADLVEQLAKEGASAQDLAPLLERALAYGSRAETVLDRVKEQGQVWLGDFGLVDHEGAKKSGGATLETVAFPPPCDEDRVETWTLWPEASCLCWDRWRFYTDLGHEALLSALPVLEKAESYFLRQFGSLPGSAREGDRIHAYLFRDDASFRESARKVVHQIWLNWFPEGGVEAFGGWTYCRLLTPWRWENRPWLGTHDALLGRAARAFAWRHHRGEKGASTVLGHGAWVLDGLEGAFEGFRLDVGGGPGIDPEACWQLAVARALREQGKLPPWEDLRRYNQTSARAVPRAVVEFELAGQKHGPVEVDVVAAQATAFVLGLLTVDGIEGNRALVTLLQHLFERGSVTDIDKTIGWKKGRAFEEAERILGGKPGQ